MEFHVSADGWLTWADARVRAALGRSGVGPKDGEGDGMTPSGRWRLKSVMFRDDRINMPPVVLPARAIAETDGWCDDPDDTAYNKPVPLPYRASFEDLWRDDHLYDVVVEVGYNDDPVVPGKGSAIFIHVATPDYGPTEGCVALALEDLVDLLAACDGDDWLVVG